MHLADNGICTALDSLRVDRAEHLAELNLSRNPLAPASVSRFARLLRGNRRLTVLDFSQCSVGKSVLYLFILFFFKKKKKDDCQFRRWRSDGLVRNGIELQRTDGMAEHQLL